jgi:hypothetical protein
MRVLSICLGGLILAAAPVAAQERDGSARPAVLQALYDCRTITDPAQRLACFEAQTAALEAAETSRDVRIVSREELRRAQRGLFGLSLPNLGNLFGGGNRDEDGEDGEDGGRDPDVVQEITAAIREIGRDASGRLVLVLDNGQRWIQTDTVGGRSPRAGQNVRIRRAALGSFIASVEERPGFRVRRDR